MAAWSSNGLLPPPQPTHLKRLRSVRRATQARNSSLPTPVRDLLSPSLMLDDSGGFISAWVRDIASVGNVYAEHFNSVGAAETSTSFTIATDATLTYQIYQSIVDLSSVGSDGEWAVVWRAADPNNTADYDLMAQFFTADDTTIGTAFQVTPSDGSPGGNVGLWPDFDIAGNAQGDLLASWIGTDDGYDPYLQQFQLNQPATVTTMPVVTADVGESLTTISLSSFFSDPDVTYGDYLSYHASSSEQSEVGTSISGSNLILNYSSANAGSAMITVDATDSTGNETSTTFNVIVDPVFASISGQSATVGVPLSVPASTTDGLDPEGTFIYGLGPGAPLGASIEPLTGVFSWTPDEEQLGSDQPITVLVSDGDNPSITASETFDVSVTGHAPTADAIPSISAVPANGRPISISRNTSTTPMARMAILSRSAPPVAIRLSSRIIHGGDLELDYAPTAGGTAEVTVTATNVWGYSVTSEIPVDVLADSTPSFVEGPDITVLEGSGEQTFNNWATEIYTGSTGSATFEVSTPDDSLFSVMPTIDSSGDLTFTPEPGVTGDAVMNLQLVNGAGVASPVQSFAINVNSAASTPIVTDGAYTAVAGTTLTVNISNGLLASAVDPDGNPLTADVVTWPSNGTLSPFANGSFDYTPNSGFTGTDSFTFTATDGENTSEPATITLTVEPAYQSPVAKSDIYSVPTLSASGTFSQSGIDGVLANDTVADGYTLTASLESSPSLGVISFYSDGAFSYSASGDFTGTDTFTYEDSDGTETTSPVTVTITNQAAPTVTPIADTSIVAGTTSTYLDLGAVFHDSTPLSYSIAANSNPGLVQASKDPVYDLVDVSLANNLVGAQEITVVATNALGLSASYTYSIWVGEEPPPPEVGSVPDVTINAGGSTVLDLPQLISDPSDPEFACFDRGRPRRGVRQLRYQWQSHPLGFHQLCRLCDRDSDD